MLPALLLILRCSNIVISKLQQTHYSVFVIQTKTKQKLNQFFPTLSSPWLPIPSLSSTGVRDAFDVSVVCVAASLSPGNTSDVRWAASLGTTNERVSSFLLKIIPGGSGHGFE